MLVQVKHSKLGFKTGFYYKKGGGRVVHTRGGKGNYAKIRMKVIKSTRTQSFLRQRRIIPEVWELTTPAPKLR